MNNSLIIIGESLIYNKPYMKYIMQELEQHVSVFDSIKILNKNDNDFFIELEDTINKYKQSIIVIENESYTFVNKIISTLNEDKLVLKDDMLIPSKTILYSQNSYLIKKEEKVINVISIKENEKIPEILLNEIETYINFTIIDIDIDSVKLLLEPLCSTYEIKINATPIVQGLISIHARAYKYGNLENFLKAVKSLFVGKFIDTDNVISHIANSLKQHNKKITAVESCTGGLICSLLTKQAGISSAFDGGLITYADRIKESWLGVSSQTLDNQGAVSGECVKEMLEGVMQASKADFALATSGIAGPDGGSEQKPVGTVFVGVKAKNKETKIERLLLKGDREYIQMQSAYYAFKLLLQTDKTVFLK